ncbi:uncharacterized protein [Rutidosis leptorrhynchoides]|uniref:uncharacterized protein isoform X2 n=1 Tax=Rutidosis leptorrhynchoides TaxID=125765 RepID=UPI003A9A11B8
MEAFEIEYIPVAFKLWQAARPTGNVFAVSTRGCMSRDIAEDDRSFGTCTVSSSQIATREILRRHKRTAAVPVHQLMVWRWLLQLLPTLTPRRQVRSHVSPLASGFKAVVGNEHGGITAVANSSR